MTRYYFEDEYFGEDREIQVGHPEHLNLKQEDPEESFDTDDEPNEIFDPNAVGSGISMGGAVSGTAGALYGYICWEKLTLGITTLYVSNTGFVRREGDPFWQMTKGAVYEDTPYMYITVETEPNTYTPYFVHELVWKAFQGDVLPNWELRHKPYVAKEFPREYPNDLCHLEIYPKVLPESLYESSYEES